MKKMNEQTANRFRSAYWALVHNLDMVRLRVWEKRHITLPQLRILFALRAHPGATTNILVKLLGLTAPTVSSLIDKLARAGLVERGQDPQDRRVIPLALTEAGQSVVGEIAQESQAYLTQLAGQLGDDLEPLTLALERLVAAIEQHPALPADLPVEVQP
jgi:DNA-binding MarR family transcriptional regulator